jgi:hypothetical protein
MAINSNFRTLTADNIEGVVAPRNYLKNSFENGTTAGWTEMAVTLTSGLPTGTPTISSTAASSIALTNTTTTPLSLSRSLLVTGAAGWTAGQGFISDEFTIDRMDGGKPLTVSFDYERNSGTLNFSGTLGSQTLMVYIYDATAGGANWIQPAGFLGMNQSSGPGRVTATFQSSVVAGQKYRVAVIASQAVGSACSLEFDNFTCSRVTAPIGPVVTDWVSYNLVIGATTTAPTPGSINVNSARWRRVGDSMEIMYNFEQGSAGTNGSGDYLFPIPAGYSIDTNKLSSMNPARSIVGNAKISFLNNTSGANTPNGSVLLGTTNPNAFKITYPNTTIEGTFTVGSTGYGLAAGALSYSFYAQVPIQGWSSSVQMSNDTDTRVVAARYRRATDQSIPNGGSGATIIWNSQTFDTHSMMNTSSGVVTIPVSGFYRYTIGQRWANAAAGIRYAGVTFTGINASKSGTPYNVFNNNGDFVTNSASDTLYFNAGDTMSVYGWQNSGAPLAFQATDAGYFEIERLSGPSVIAASETVAMRAVKSSGSHTLNGNTQAIGSWTGAVQDTHAIFNLTTGVATIPVSGTYLCTYQVCFVTNATGSRVAQLYKNNIMEAESNIYLSFGDRPVMTGTCLIKCNAGDTINLGAFQNSGGNLAYSAFQATSTALNIVRVGN